MSTGSSVLSIFHFQPSIGTGYGSPQWKYIELFSQDGVFFVLQPSSVDKAILWKIIIDILTEPTPRQKLDHINSLDDVVELLRGSKNIVVLTGAGVCTH